MTILPEVQSPYRPIAWAEFTAELLDLYAPPLRARATWVLMRQVLRQAGELLGDDGATDGLTTSLVGRFIKARPSAEAATTTSKLVRTLRTACAYAAARGYLHVSPFSLRKSWIRVPSGAGDDKRRFHPIEAIARVLELASADIDRKRPGSVSQWRARRLNVLVNIAAYTGMRKNEILFLRREDIDIPGRVIEIRPRDHNRLKTEKSAQPIPMLEPLAAVLAEWLPHLAIPRGWSPNATDSRWSPHWNPDGVRDDAWMVPNVYRSGPWTGGPPGYKPLDRIKRLGVRCGIEGLTLLSFRHSFATHAESAWGLSDLQIQRILRHTNLRTQRSYRHAEVKNLRDACRGVSFGVELPAISPPAAVEPASPGHLVPSSIAPPPAVETPAPPSRPATSRAYAGPKLSDADVAELRELRRLGFTYGELCTRFNVAKSTVHYALFGGHRDVPREGV
jgi:integrase